MKKFVNNNMKKIISIIIILLMLPLLVVSAYTPKELSKYAKEISEAKKWQLEGQVELTKQEIATVYNGSLAEPLLYNNHTVQWLSVGAESAVKPVVWSVGNSGDWKATNLDRTIEDYEAKHPGYIVVGAVNGDFFDNSTGGTGEPTNYHVQEGDVLRAAAPGASYRGVLGFGETNKDHVAVFGQQRSQYMYYRVFENDEVVKEKTVMGSNKLPSEAGLNVYTEDIATNIDLSNYTVYEGTYTRYRFYSGGIFLEGALNKVSDVTKVTQKNVVKASIKEALEFANKTYVTIQGTVSQINSGWNGSTMSVTIKDDTGEISCVDITGKVEVGQLISITGQKEKSDVVNRIASGANPESIEEANKPATAIEPGKFYIAVKNDTLELNENFEISYDLAGELEGIQNAVGFIYQVLKDGQPQYANTTSSNNSNAAFINTTHPRTLVGFKEDGSVVLMVIDGRGSVGDNLEGASLFQCGELLRLAGCVEGYNLDGGGSSTLMARINGQMTLINDPSDARQTGQPWGTLRSTGNAVLLVMKDPKLTIEEPVGNTITIKKTGNVVGGTLQNVKLKIDSKEYDMTGDELTISGLKKNMEYNVSYSYEILNNDGTIDKGQTHTYVLTTEDYVFPELKSFEESDIKDGTVTFKYRVNDDDGTIKKMYVKNGDVEAVVEGLSGKVTIENIDTTIENTFILMAELENGQKVELGKIVYEANSIPGGVASDTPSNPNDSTDDEKSGCKKDLTMIVVSMISLSTLFVFIKKKR